MMAPVILAVFVFGFLILPLVLATLPTSPVVKWTSTVLAALFFACALASALPEEADIPPCPLILPFLLYTAAAYRHWFHPKKRTALPGHCRKCEYDLTGNVSGICPECGTPVQDQMTDGMPHSGSE